MWDQEKKHLAKFDEILAENRIRPTLLLPLWNVTGFLLGKVLFKEIEERILDLIISFHFPQRTYRKGTLSYIIITNVQNDMFSFTTRWSIGGKGHW